GAACEGKARGLPLLLGQENTPVERDPEIRRLESRFDPEPTADRKAALVSRVHGKGGLGPAKRGGPIDPRPCGLFQSIPDEWRTQDPWNESQREDHDDRPRESSAACGLDRASVDRREQARAA